MNICFFPCKILGPNSYIMASEMYDFSAKSLGLKTNIFILTFAWLKYSQISFRVFMNVAIHLSFGWELFVKVYS